MPSTSSHQQLERARNLRSASTGAETKLWHVLRAKRLEGLKFKRQVPVGGFIVDFVCMEDRLVIELDGSQHGEDDAVRYDERRTRFLEGEGYRVARFWNGMS